MRRRILSGACGLITLFGCLMQAQAQGSARLRVTVTVAPIVHAHALQGQAAVAENRQAADLRWASRPQNHVVTRMVDATEFKGQWGENPDLCGADSTKVLSDENGRPPCEITVNTTVYVVE